MKLKKLLKDCPDVVIKGSKEVEITGVCASSKLVAPGNLFIAKKGRTFNGHDFIPEAIAAGAAAILTDIYDPTIKQTVQLIHPHLPKMEALLAASYSQHPSAELFTVGVTGTNGKTTTAMCIKHLLDSLSIPAGLIGTIEYRVGDHRYEAPRTTPDVCLNQKLLREMVNHGCRAAVLEVTSHALDQERVAYVDFDAAIFTNLSHEHLDYHKTMELYAAAKSKLFQSLKRTCKKGQRHPPTAIINSDSPWHKAILSSCSAPVLTYGIEGNSDLQATHVRFHPQGTDFQLSYKGETAAFHSPMTGRFNLYNSLAALAVGVLRQVPLSQLAPIFQSFRPVRGRLERVPNALNLNIYVDYAHTEDALFHVLSCLREVTQGKLICVFGCGGDRDRFKRPLMGAVSEKLADLTIVTSDNPRSEIPENICAEILSGFRRKENVYVQVDRRLAIEQAIRLATPQDTLLIAGKGHETRQVFAHQTVDFDDCQVASESCLHYARERK